MLMKPKIKAEADYLFEISWEVCNKVGGIYTVLTSKAARMADYYQNYYLLGPYFKDKIKGEFQEIEAIPKNFQKIFRELGGIGIKCHFGKWLIKGEPKTILIDFADFSPQGNQIKKELWEDYGIDSLWAGYDFTEPVVFSWAAGILLEKIAISLKNKKIVAHFHEWLSGAGLLYLKKKKIKLGTVFTTHATVLGRTLANNNLPLYYLLEKIEPEKEIYRFNIQAKHQLEKNATKFSDVFSTISEITALETQKFLERTPDILLPNGLDIAKYPTFEDIVIKHRIQRRRIREFLLYYFFPYYTFDIKNTLIYSIFGRYEFQNKGIGLFIRALARLNKKLREEKSKKTIISFFWIPAEVREIKAELLQNKEFYQDIKDYLEEATQELQENLIYSLITGKKIPETLLPKDFWKEIEKKLIKFKKEGLPPLSTHNLSDQNDLILKTFQEEGLTNKKDDRVKVVFYPIYLTGSDGLINLNYYEAVEGSHLGVFPSFYEPWGYTVLETAAFGVTALTTDLSGVGRFFLKFSKKEKYPGIFILKRFNKGEDKVLNELFKILYHFSSLSRHQRIENEIQAREKAALSDWKILIKNYINAHNQALRICLK